MTPRRFYVGGGLLLLVAWLLWLVSRDEPRPAAERAPSRPAARTTTRVASKPAPETSPARVWDGEGMQARMARRRERDRLGRERGEPEFLTIVAGDPRIEVYHCGDLRLEPPSEWDRTTTPGPDGTAVVAFRVFVNPRGAGDRIWLAAPKAGPRRYFIELVGAGWVDVNLPDSGTEARCSVLAEPPAKVVLPDDALSQMFDIWDELEAAWQQLGREPPPEFDALNPYEHPEWEEALAGE